ncbi:MAG: hypothetical protein U9Q70_09255, partial [Chloroflexota bacterium]|nr:hypothetical protein [Chloroflexota bacterium]
MKIQTNVRNKHTSVRIVRSIIIAQRGRRRQRSRTGVSLWLRVIGVVVLIALLASVLLVGGSVGAAAAAYSMITEGLPT